MLVVVIIGLDAAMIEMSLSPLAVTPEPATYAETVSLRMFSVSVTPTARLNKPTESETDTISEEMVDVSSAETNTAPADCTLLEFWMKASTTLVSVLLAVVTAPDADTPIEALTATLAAAVNAVMPAISSAVTETPPTVVVRLSAFMI